MYVAVCAGSSVNKVICTCTAHSDIVQFDEAVFAHAPERLCVWVCVDVDVFL